MVKKLLATLTTDSQGRATYTYTGTGAGDVKFSAESTNNGSLQSETYAIYDCIAYNKETSASDFLTYWNSSNNNANTITVDDNGTLIETDASKHSSTYMQIWLKEFPNYLNVPLCYEIEIVENTNYSFSFPIKITDGTILWWSSSRGATGKLRVEIDSEKAIYYLNDVEQWRTTSSQIPTQSRCYLQSVRANGNGRIKFKNLKIYPI